ncbi:regulating synaptic membrane exocytosis protein 2 isoform X3 [Ooceraea biroi]|uniref:regulating synaptic membrane exocytosis protein 2 isoform X3 n=1 Tax=Ooceraea biroi TaxID=2015173 RepID=UPI000F077CA5|nr:regulating synaptic membrane exocytosis protein 2 isoform X3 [Ooceraea biroi]
MAELPQPDMSHLTPEERRIIENVLMRQKEEEKQDIEAMRRKQDEVQVLEESIRIRSEIHKKAGVELNATCHICLKTKFADGVGHICNYCEIRCCARCGGKVTLRSSKVIWVCILCRKKQELLSKTGQWMSKTGLGAADTAMLRQMQDMQVGGPQGLADQTQDKRPKLERAHSAAEKENLPLLQRSGNCPLRRQYSQQEQLSGRRISSDNGMEISPHSRTLPTPHVVVGSYPVQQTPRHPAAYPDDDPSLYRGEIDGLMRQHPQNYQKQRSYQDQSADLGMTYGQSPMESGSVRSAMHLSQQHSMHQMQGGRPAQPASTGVQQQRSLSSSEEERSTEYASDEPDESEKGKGYYHHAGGPKSMSSGGRRHNGSHNGHHTAGASLDVEHNGHHPPREPRKEENTLVRRSFRRCGDEWRADSRRFTERRGKKTVRFDGGTNVGGSQEEWSWEADRQGSQDSATKDSGIDTSSTFTSSEDSNRGDLPKHPLSWQMSENGQKLIGHMVLRKSAGSGSSSSILGLKVVGGKLLEDGSMGAVIEKVKRGSTADIEGQLRPGDEVIEWNGRSLQGKSFREVYDIIAESREEPQIELVVERKLSTGMLPAGPGPSTPIASRRIVAQSQWRQKHETISGPQQPHHKDLYDTRREKPSVLVTSPGSPDLHAQGRGRHSRHPTGNANVGGSIQVKLGYDSVAGLIVTIVGASGLTPKSNGELRNPYAKMYLLPDRSEKSKQRTRTVANTNDPRWNQSFLYHGIRRTELRKRALEITVWDYARYEANDFLGEVVLELAVCPLDEEPEWHPLTVHGEHRHVRHYQDDDMIDCHLSPPSTTSRLSDSDTSECDATDCDVSREQRRTADGASISSIGSSSRFHNMPSNYKRHYSSPPPERELCIDGEHRSRRDMSPQGRKRAALMISRDQPTSIGSSYPTYRKDDIHRGMMGHRSHSAAPMDSPSVRYRGRSQSPTGHRSLSPPEHRSIPYSHGYVHTRFGSRSATATPTGSPKKRQLPQIPAALKERVVQDLEERARFMRHRNRQSIYRSTGMGGWEKHYSGLSDSDLPSIGHDPLTLPHVHRLHRPKKGRLSPDKDVVGDFGDSDMESIASVTSSAFSTQSERPGGSRTLMPGCVGLLSRRAKSFEYESISSNIFSDDSLRTARRKLKRNLSLSDAGYGDKIPALGDHSKSYFDSNGDDKVPSLASKETNYDFLLDDAEHKPFYGYDSELSCGETEIYVPSFDKSSIETTVDRIAEAKDYKSAYGSRPAHDSDLFSDNDRANLRNILDKEDTGKRKYADGSYLNHDTSYIRDISTEKRTKNVEGDLCNPIGDHHIYCSIDEALSSSENYERNILARSATKIHDASDIDHWISKDVKEVLRSHGGTAGHSYRDNGYKSYDSWDTDYDEGFIDRDKDYEEKQFDYRDKGVRALRSGGSAYESEYDGADRTRGKRYARFDNDGKLATSDYISYRPSDDYEYQAAHTMGTNEDGSMPRRRRRRSRRDSREGGVGGYESSQIRDTVPGVQPRLTESRRSTIQRTESTPTLHSDEDLSSIADRTRRMYRRRRNSSCPESRDLRLREGLFRHRDIDERTSSFVLESDEEFGSVETVVGADYYRRTSGVTGTRANGIRASGFLHAGQDRGSYLDSRYDYEDRYQDRSYPGTRELVRSGSQRASSRDGRHASRTRRKSSCPECRELALSTSELGRSGSLSRRGDDTRRSSVEAKHRYRRRNSSCPEARDLEMLEKRQRPQQLVHRHQQQLQRHPSQQQQQQQQQQQRPQHQQGSSKRNVAISDTLEYYEYSMESESQCSENCGFGPCDPRRPRNRAPRPGNANSSLFDSQTATSDTAKNYHPRVDDHHHQYPQNTKTSPLANVVDVASSFLPRPSSSSSRQRSRKKSAYDVDGHDRTNVAAAAAGAIGRRGAADDARNRRSSSMPESSEYTSQPSSYEKTSRHQVTDNGHDKRNQFTRSLSNADVPQDEKDTGSFSDTALALNVDDTSRRGRKSSPGSKSGSGSSSGSAVQYQAGLGKKSNSTSQLSATECGGMFIGGGSAAARGPGGLASRKRNSTPSSIQRSEEIMPMYQRFDVGKQAGSAASDTAGSLNSISSSEGSSWSPSLRMAGEGQLRDFIEDLGPGQVVGRQALGARCLGEIQLSLSQTKGYLEVEVIRAKDLKAKQGSKVIPAPYVKLYVVNGKRCIAKAKTTTARKTLDPFYQQLLAFKENCRGCILQVTVWGDYGRIEGKKVFMGIAQIVLDELDLNQMVFGWYKLFGTQSLVSGPSSLALSRRSSATSLDSFRT